MLAIKLAPLIAALLVTFCEMIVYVNDATQHHDMVELNVPMTANLANGGAKNVLEMLSARTPARKKL